VVDAFPLQPVPASIGHIAADLYRELEQADAPLSGRNTACVLVTEHAGYGGHVVEHSPTDVEDGFEMALDKVPYTATILGILATGKGTMKEKHIMPFGSTYDKLAPRLAPTAPIIMIPPNSRDTCRIIPAAMHEAAYEPKAPSIFQGATIFESEVEAIRYTALSPKDCAFVARLRHAGLDNGIHYYLTGSSSAQGAPSYALRPLSYNDLDIIAVGGKGKAHIEASFESLAESMYGPLEKEQKIVRVAASESMLEGVRYCNDTGISIDFFPTAQLEQAFVRPEYLQRNFYHQLS
jgi:hypothetical protein